VAPLAIRAGHSMMPGTRMPPSHSVFFFPRRPPLEPAIAPLSLLNQTSVFSATPSLRRPARSVPIARSTPSSSP